MLFSGNLSNDISVRS